jgi:hypothetical protein
LQNSKKVVVRFCCFCLPWMVMDRDEQSGEEGQEDRRGKAIEERENEEEMGRGEGQLKPYIVARSR